MSPAPSTAPMSTGPSEADIALVRATHKRICDAAELALRGKRGVLEQVVVAMLARGHVLLEDVPGTGKTTLARALAVAVGGVSTRIQFTPDLLPSDVTGTSVYDPQTGSIAFREGPVFGNVLLADEINRAAAKTQSALLEVMQERTVTADGRAHAVPSPFLVVATQNPVDLDGTYRLPEAQLDRFLIRVQLGYPGPEDELEVIRPGSRAGDISGVPTVSSPAEVNTVADICRRVHVADALLRYVRDLGAASREEPRLRLGASPRALSALVHASQVLAACRGRHYVVPSDIQTLAGSVLAHRLHLGTEASASGETTEFILADLLARVEVPQPAAT